VVDSIPFNELKTRTIDGIEGLYTIISQDAGSKEVLMVAYANREALEKTLETGKAHYYSTSRKKIWLKGESSGNTQTVDEVLVDCDGDAVIYKVSEAGPACHMGFETCFYRRVENGVLRVCKPQVFDPKDVYK